MLQAKTKHPYPESERGSVLTGERRGGGGRRGPNRRKGVPAVCLCDVMSY